MTRCMPRLIAKLVFTNVTPLWTGGPLGGATYNILGDKVVGPWLPDAKPIIGRVRWLLRAAEASAHARAGRTPPGLKDVDTIASRIFGDTGHASKIVIRVHAIPDPGLLPQNGCTRCYVPADPGLYRRLVNLARSLAHLPRRVRSDLGSMLEVDAFIEMRRRLGLIHAARPYLGRRGEERYAKYQDKLREHLGQPPQEALKLIAIPRVRLLLQGTDNIAKIVTHQPLPPGTVRLEVEIYERASSGLKPGEAKLAVVATAYTLAFLGIGKAVSRGFGRFFLAEPPETREPVSDVEGILEWFMEARLGNPRNAGSVFKGTGRWIVEQACRLLSLDSQCSTMPQQPHLLHIPSLDVAIASTGIINVVRHPCPYALLELTAPNKPGCCNGRRPVREIHDALSAVGRAAMKVMWKLCSGARVDKPGPGYHTWVLGLPRRGKVSVCGREVATGYRIAHEDFWAMYEDCYACGGQEFGEARRASPLLVTSHCSSGGCYALLEPFATLDDLAELLAGPHPLVHIGVHGIRRHNPLVHVVGVYKAATNKVLGANGCPADQGSIAHPPTSQEHMQPSDPKDVVIEAFQASLEWFRFLLS